MENLDTDCGRQMSVADRNDAQDIVNGVVQGFAWLSLDHVVVGDPELSLYDWLLQNEQSRQE